MPSLAELAAVVDVSAAPGWKDLRVDGAREDSRAIQPGELFVAVPGGNCDGADFAVDAVRRGAVAVVAERACPVDVPVLVVDNARRALALLSAELRGHPTQDLHTVGVTGTSGKTTVCHLAAALFGADVTALVGTVANEGRGLRAVTTPTSPVVQQIASDARTSGKRFLVIEASSIGIVQHRLDGVDFNAAALTNVTRDHYEAHGGREAYLDAKLGLFRMLDPSASAVVNLGDPACEQFLRATRARSLTYAVDRAADLSAWNVRSEAWGTRFEVAWKGDRAEAHVPLPGRYNVENALAALALGLSSGLPLDALCRRLRAALPVPGRFEVFERQAGPVAIVDFAHTPDALRNALENARSRFRYVTVVFGCPGASDRGKRAEMGAIAGRLAVFTVLTADNPKHEAPDAIADEIEIGVRAAGGPVERILDRGDAIRRALEATPPEGAVLVAGKGHETYQIVGDRFVPYSDAAVLEAAGYARLVRGAQQRRDELF